MPFVTLLMQLLTKWKMLLTLPTLQQLLLLLRLQLSNFCWS